MKKEEKKTKGVSMRGNTLLLDGGTTLVIGGHGVYTKGVVLAVIGSKRR